MANDLLTVGKITGHFGVHGGVKVFSYTRPMDNITDYNQWYIGEQLYKGIKAKKHGKTIIASIPNISSREAAQMLVGQTVAVETEQLASLNDDDYYWHQLIGLTVINHHGTELGRVDSLFETGANDVMVVKNKDEQLLIPYLYDQTVKQVDLSSAVIQVEWDEEE